MVQFNLKGNFLNALSSEGTLIVAAKGIDLSFNCRDDGMECSTCDFMDIHGYERIGYDCLFGLSIFFFIFLILKDKLFDVGEADRSFGLHLLLGVIVLIGFT